MTYNEARQAMEIGPDDKITREQFRRLAMAAMNSCIEVSDEVWENGLPQVIWRFQNGTEIIVGIRAAYDDETVDTMVRYERALDRIAQGTFGEMAKAIANTALGNPGD